MIKSVYLLCVFTLLSLPTTYAQISKVMYQLEYDESSKVYTAVLVVTEGVTKSKKDNVQFNAQMGIVCPSGSKIKVIQNHNPITLDGEATIWSNTSIVVQPQSSNQNTYYGVTPNLAPTAFYDNLKYGDERKLFSFTINPQPQDPKSVRFFDASVDPNKNEEGMMGADFNHGFTIGNFDQVFNGTMPLKIITSTLAEAETK